MTLLNSKTVKVMRLQRKKLGKIDSQSTVEFCTVRLSQPYTMPAISVKLIYKM